MPGERGRGPAKSNLQAQREASRQNHSRDGKGGASGLPVSEENGPLGRTRELVQRVCREPDGITTERGLEEEPGLGGALLGATASRMGWLAWPSAEGWLLLEVVEDPVLETGLGVAWDFQICSAPH